MDITDRRLTHLSHAIIPSVLTGKRRSHLLLAHLPKVNPEHYHKNLATAPQQSPLLPRHLQVRSQPANGQSDHYSASKANLKEKSHGDKIISAHFYCR